MSEKNGIMLIAYPDSLGKNLRELKYVLKKYLQGAVSGIHILPFFPSSGDRGFAPVTYDEVDPAFGSWADISELSKDYDLMVDFMINHISRQSAIFKDYLAHKDESPYAGMFIRYHDLWPGGSPSAEDAARIYRRKPRDPYVDVSFPDGTSEKLWCTFAEEQIDLNWQNHATREFIRTTLLNLARRGVMLIRLDAFAYIVKKPGTSCFFVEPKIWEVLEFTRATLAPLGVEILPEVHEHPVYQQKLAAQDYWVYDFALPMLVLHALYSGTSRRLMAWLHSCPNKQFTTLDTHDGIGVVDVRGLLSDTEIEETKAALFDRGAQVKKIYNTQAYGNLDVYQINCTYYSALGNNDEAYLLARAIQFFAPGIPQVYYVGLLAGENDIDLVEQTKNGRDINRHNYSLTEIDEQMTRPVVQRLLNLMRFRNTYPAFGGTGHFPEPVDDHQMRIVWQEGKYAATLQADLKNWQFSVRYFDPKISAERELTGI